MKIAEIITEKIIEKLEGGKIPWQKPWNTSTDSPKNLVSNKEYRGVNVFLLLFEGFTNPYWLTMKQANDLGGKIKKGSRSTLIVYWNWRPTETIDKNGEVLYSFIPYLRYYTVFNIEQVEGDIKLPSHYLDYLEIKPNNSFNSIETAENLINGYKDKPEIQQGGSQAFYMPSKDLIQVPLKENFINEESYYATLFHELAHSTGHKNRLNRDSFHKNCPFGSHEYSKEELVAELTSSFLQAESGIFNEDQLKNSSAYLQSWLKALKNDKNLFLTASQAAQKAFDYIKGKTVEDKEPTETEILQLK